MRPKKKLRAVEEEASYDAASETSVEEDAAEHNNKKGASDEQEEKIKHNKQKSIINIKPRTSSAGTVHSEEEAETTSDGEDTEKKGGKKGIGFEQKESNGPFIVDDKEDDDADPATPSLKKATKNCLKGLIEDLPTDKGIVLLCFNVFSFCFFFFPLFVPLILVMSNWKWKICKDQYIYLLFICALV